MAFYGYNGDLDKYYSTPYNTTFQDFASAPIQASLPYYPPYEYVEPDTIEYKSCAYYRDDSFTTPLESNYSFFTYSEPEIVIPNDYHSSSSYYEYSVNPSEVHFYNEPKLLQYESSSPYTRDYFPSETKFTISYSTVEFNEPEFEEYDPTPYDGGYDISTTYGKSIPPSDITCYPRSAVSKSGNTSLENFSYSSIPSPYGKDDDIPLKPPSDDSKQVETKVDDVENGDKVILSDGGDVEIVDESENEFKNGTSGDYGYESENQTPYGSGLETMDICESLFGYWPCLAKRDEQRKSKCRHFCDEERRMDPWKSAVDYLFGSPLVYDYENYQLHNQQGRYECYEDSWLQ